FRWKHDPACKNVQNPAECGWTGIPLADIYGSSPQAAPALGVRSDLALTIEPHDVPLLEYGPLVNAILEWRLLPLMFGDGSAPPPANCEALPPIDSWDDLVSTIFGDSLCLCYDDCCDYFAQRIEDDVPGYVAAIAPQACEAAIPLLANLIRGQITGLRGPM